MFFAKPNNFKILLANGVKNDFTDEILIYEIDENYNLVEIAPIDLFFHSRNRLIIEGYDAENEIVSKRILTVRTKEQYGGEKPIYSVNDLIEFIKTLIDDELTKGELY